MATDEIIDEIIASIPETGSFNFQNYLGTLFYNNLMISKEKTELQSEIEHLQLELRQVK